ncbi:hypothetical protein [Polynucleobacter necessarius]
MHTGQSMQLTPINDGLWEDGWLIQSGCIGKKVSSSCQSKIWLFQGRY